MKLEKLRLILDVDFNAETVNMPVLRGHLEQVVKDAVNNGTLTGDSPATVERYSFKITSPRRPKRSVKPLKICAVCGFRAITTRRISINNGPKELAYVCEIHADAANEDDDIAEQQRRDEKNGLYPQHIDPAKLTFMSLTQKREYNALTPEQKRIYDSVMESFPATRHASAYDVAIQGGIRFQFIFK